MAEYEVELSMWTRRMTVVYVEADSADDAREMAKADPGDSWEYAGDSKPVTAPRVRKVK